jgi:hypothetical protein
MIFLPGPLLCPSCLIVIDTELHLFAGGIMREIFRHNPGRIFLIVLLLSVIGILWVPKYFFKPHIFFGWLPLPFLAGIIFVLVWLVAYLIYFFKYWPFRD